MAGAMPVPQTEKNWLERVLSLAADVRPGEAGTTLLLSLNVFLLLAAYYVIRPIRSALILTGGGAEVQSYSGAIQAGLFLLIVPAYGAFASKMSRIRLINWVTLIFFSNLLVFFALGNAGASPKAVGIAFYLWVGIFNVMVIAQFWSLANDVYTLEQGKRLFALVGFGASVGAIAGSVVIRTLVRPLGVFVPMLISAGLLLLCLALGNVIHAREKQRAAGAARQRADQPLGAEGGFQLVLRHNYFLLIGLLTVAVQLINTNGNYIRDSTLTRAAKEAVAAGTAGGLDAGQFIAQFHADLDFFTNVVVVLIQFFLVSRIFKYLGVDRAVFLLPAIELCGYAALAFSPALAYIRIVRIAENGTDYSLQNTLRRALFLPTSREAKYKALQAVETFFWRAGDMLSGLATLLLVQVLGLGVRHYAGVNVALAVVALAVAAGIASENRKLTARTQAEAAA